MTWQFLLHACKREMVQILGGRLTPPVSWFHFSEQGKWPASAIRANENIPIPHHRAQTTLEQ
jgi:hypothetical protein